MPSNNSENKITVITVVFNGQKYIEQTILSVINQSYANIEYIIIDGGSTDGTVDIIQKYSDHIHYWCSEPDKGVYDAMNKGIDHATGKWINFMNAGDYFYSPDSILQMFSTDDDIEKYAIIYGDAEFRLNRLSYIIEARENSESNEFMPFSHQASFVRSDIAKKTKFDLSYKIAADTAFSLRLIREGYQFKHFPVIVCSYDAQEGLSVKNEIRRSKELVTMQEKLNGADPNTPYFKKYIRDAYIKQYIRRLIPSFIWNKMRENKIKKNYDYKYLND
jgi:glycosyltransferase involved in cell wall biosynthesis